MFYNNLTVRNEIVVKIFYKVTKSGRQIDRVTLEKYSDGSIRPGYCLLQQ